MEVQVLSNKENKFLRRNEIRAVVRHAGSQTPKRAEVREALAKALSVPKELLVIDSMHSLYGRNETTVYAKRYIDKEALKIEREHILVRNGLAEKKEAQPKAAKKPAAKAS